jgi:hypothetical protein
VIGDVVVGVWFVWGWWCVGFVDYLFLVVVFWGDLWFMCLYVMVYCFGGFINFI